jgi:hypothetical protein
MTFLTKPVPQIFLTSVAGAIFLLGQARNLDIIFLTQQCSHLIGKDMEERKLLYTVGGNANLYMVIIENSMEVSQKIKK